LSKPNNIKGENRKEILRRTKKKAEGEKEKRKRIKKTRPKHAQFKRTGKQHPNQA
jgi:hypothetical protein